MDIVSILLTIILAGAIATFILAVIAYVLHRAGLRERRRRRSQHTWVKRRRRVRGVRRLVHRREKLKETGTMPAHPPAATPPLSASTPPPWAAPPPPTERSAAEAESESFAESPDPSSLFWEYTSDGFVPVDPSRSTRRKNDDETGTWR